MNKRADERQTGRKTERKNWRNKSVKNKDRNRERTRKTARKKDKNKQTNMSKEMKIVERKKGTLEENNERKRQGMKYRRKERKQRRKKDRNTENNAGITKAVKKKSASKMYIVLRRCPFHVTPAFGKAAFEEEALSQVHRFSAGASSMYPLALGKSTFKKKALAKCL